MVKKIDLSTDDFEDIEKAVWELPKHRLGELRKTVLKVCKQKYEKHKKLYFVPPDERVFTVPQLKLFFDAVKSPTYRLCYRTMLFCGMRVGEAATLKKDDLDRENQCFRVWIEKKSNPVRLPKYYPTKFGEEIDRYFSIFDKEIGVSGDYIFFNRFKNGPLIPNSLGKYFREILEQTKLERFYANANDKRNPKVNDRQLRFLTTNSFRKTHSTMIYTYYAGAEEVSSRALHHTDTKVTKEHYIGRKVALLRILDLAFEDLL